ncbi:hypothetical protein [uncultured Celeribacter sp.]|uniref:hypothetical protein n=1 Tax=uncultured Celeribacter sp. TaxID=1303376 RepID=UPI002AA81225|nr:hypothetical protein [uncultured Celeribacter sp.]
MAAQDTNHFTTFQGRSLQATLNAKHRRFRMPMATLVLGFLAAAAIAGGALDTLVARQVTGGLTDVEFLIAPLPDLE